MLRLIIFLGFFMSIVALGSYFSFKVFSLYGIFKNIAVYRVVLSAYIGLPIIFVATNILGNMFYSKITSFFYTISAVWIGGLMYMFLISVVLGILYFFIKHLSATSVLSIGIIGVVSVVGLITYSIWNASTIRTTHMYVHAPRLAPLWSDKTIVLFSDTHLGNIRGHRFAENVTKKINQQNPDLVLMAGDMIDGPIIPYKTFTEPFKNITATFGTYYTPGNHEWYNNEPEKFLQNLDEKVITLIDKKIEINGTQIVGINYAQESEDKTLERLVNTGFEKEIPSLALLHDPKNNDVLRQSGVDLVVSGHTHCGQFWPITQIVRSIYKDKTYGVRQFETSATLTTCGVGTAMAPFRLGSKAEIVVVHIQ